MKLGFIGTGEITSSIVTGLSSATAAYNSILVSPRNREIANELADRFEAVSIASTNQDVLDASDVIVIAVRPFIAPSAISELRFRPDHCVISLVSGLPLKKLSELVAPSTRIIRAVPLPSTARRVGPTGIFPPDTVADDIFARVGTVFPLETEHEFEVLCAATATIASAYAFMAEIASWLGENGIPDRRAREYVARMICGVSSAVAEAPDQSFQSFVKAHATAGGINEEFLKHISDAGLLDGIPVGLNAVLKRIESASQKESEV